ncbi:hypothetical protein BDY24DRAFT_239249 [Mrakia frigida]|uniref:uncharacterized protein n=1 Tax=Mrakia frigida TaxID=29902 RepID=UPI003FCC2315
MSRSQQRLLHFRPTKATSTRPPLEDFTTTTRTKRRIRLLTSRMYQRSRKSWIKRMPRPSPKSRRKLPMRRPARKLSKPFPFRLSLSSEKEKPLPQLRKTSILPLKIHQFLSRVSPPSCPPSRRLSFPRARLTSFLLALRFQLLLRSSLFLLSPMPPLRRLVVQHVSTHRPTLHHQLLHSQTQILRSRFPRSSTEMDRTRSISTPTRLSLPNQLRITSKRSSLWGFTRRCKRIQSKSRRWRRKREIRITRWRRASRILLRLLPRWMETSRKGVRRVVPVRREGSMSWRRTMRVERWPRRLKCEVRSRFFPFLLLRTETDRAPSFLFSRSQTTQSSLGSSTRLIAVSTPLPFPSIHPRTPPFHLKSDPSLHKPLSNHQPHRT